MKVLIACEQSQVVCKEFIDRGHDAISCDILPGALGLPHHKGYLEDYIGDGSEWDLIIAFPPCTHLAVSGAKHFERKRADGRQQKGIAFFMMIANRNCQKIAIENPVGIMSSEWRKPDQIIQPYYFGDPFQKTTCLWLKGLPKLMHNESDHVNKGEFVTTPSGKRLPKWYSDNKNATNRSKTFPGIAKAMAEQWG